MAVAVTVVDTVQVGSNQTSTSFSFASGSFSAGDLIIIVFTKDDDVEPTMPSGFTNLLSFESTNAMWLTVAYKEAVTADETATGYTVTHDAEQTVGVLYRITGANTTPTAHSDSTDIAQSTSITLSAATGNNADSVVFTGLCHDDGRNITNGRFIDSTVTTEDFNGRSSGAVNDSNGCGMVIGHWSPGSTSIPSLTHGGMSSAQEIAAYLVEVEPAAATGPTADADFTLADATIAADADVAVQADTAFTLADATVAADADVAVPADTAFTLADATVAALASGQTIHNADSAFTLADATVAAIVEAIATADASFTLADATVAADADVAVQADTAFTLADATVAADADVAVRADVAISLDDFLVAAETAVEVIGDAAIVLDAVSVASYAAETIPADPLETVDAAIAAGTVSARIRTTTESSDIDVQTVTARI